MTRWNRDEDEHYVLDDAKAVAESQSKLALRVKTREKGEFWVPKSVIHDDSEVYEKGHEGKLCIQLWWCEKQGW